MFKFFFIFSPLAQFDVIVFLKFFLILFDFSVTNLSLTMMLFSSIFSLLVYFFNMDLSMIPKIWQYFLELIFLFMVNLMYTQMGSKGLMYLPFILSLFFFMIFLNMFGLLPFSFAATSHFFWTLYFSLSLCLGIFFIGLSYYNVKFLKLFLPDVPLILYPLMILMELASYMMSSFSLAISLSANMMAGHILVHILVDVIYEMCVKGLDMMFMFVVLLLFLFVLEFGMACLQAYVFTLLLCIYMNDSLNLHLH